MPVLSTPPPTYDWKALSDQFAHADADTLITWAVEQFAPNLALTCSFGGASGMVLLDLALRVKRDLPVLLIDTDVLFDQTYELVAAIERHYGIAVQRIRPALSLDQQAARYAPELHTSQPDVCCNLRKVEPLQHALAPYSAWLTAIRRDQSTTRLSTPLLAWNEKHQLVKICPLASWTERDIWRYIHANSVPYNPLLDQGYSSLGCHTCTHKPVNDDPRSGRWLGFAKTECGLHT